MRVGGHGLLGRSGEAVMALVAVCAACSADAGPAEGARDAERSAASDAEQAADDLERRIYRIPLRVHVSRSELVDAELHGVLAELNDIWLSQAGICFEIEVTEDEANLSSGLDLRLTSEPIPGSPTVNGITRGAHDVWSLDRPRLGPAPNPGEHPAARTSAHELGHVLGLPHQNPPPATDCGSPCYCITLDLECDDLLMRSGRRGTSLSAPEVESARSRAPKWALGDTSKSSCGAVVDAR